MNEFDRVVIDPEVCLGQPTVRGIRITVAFIVKLVENGHSVEEILDFYPELEAEDVRQAVEYTKAYPCEA